MSTAIPPRSSWILKTDHVINPYLGTLPHVKQPIEPAIQPPSSYPHFLSKPWLWSQTGFTRPLTDDEQTVFNEFVEPFFHGQIDGDHLLADTNTIAFLLCANVPMQQAFVRAAEYAITRPPVIHIDFGQARSIQIGPITHAALWLSVWPWIPMSVRQALHPFILRHWKPDAQLALTMVDEQYSPTLPSSWPLIVRSHTRKILETPMSSFALVDAICASYHAHPERTFSHVERLIFTFLGPEELEEIFQRTSCPLFLALTCHLSPSKLTSRALCEERLAYTDAHPYREMILTHPYFAALNPLEQILAHEQHYPIRWMHPWIYSRRVDVPRLDKTSSTSLRDYLCRELEGPYADLAEPVWAWAFRESPPVRPYVSNNRPLNPREIDDLLTSDTTPEAGLSLCIRYGPPMTGVMLAEHPRVTTELIHRLSLHYDDTVRAAVVSRPLLREDDLDRLASRPTKRIEAELIAHDELSPQDAQRYLKHPSPTIRGGLAKNPTLSQDVRLTLMRDPSSSVRAKLVEAAMLPESILRQLAADPSPVVRRAVLLNLDCPVELLSEMGKDRDSEVRNILASNPDTPAVVIAHLAKRASWYLAGILIKHPALSDVDRIRLTLMVRNRG